MGPRWAETAADQIEKARENGELSDDEYREEMRGLREEVQDAAWDAYNETMDY